MAAYLARRVAAENARRQAITSDSAVSRTSDSAVSAVRRDRHGAGPGIHGAGVPDPDEPFDGGGTPWDHGRRPRRGQRSVERLAEFDHDGGGAARNAEKRADPQNDPRPDNPQWTPEQMVNELRRLHGTRIDGFELLTHAQALALVRTLHELLRRNPISFHEIEVALSSNEQRARVVVTPVIKGRELSSAHMKITLPDLEGEDPDGFIYSMNNATIEGFAEVLMLAGRWRAIAQATPTLLRAYREHHDDHTDDGFTEWLIEQFGPGMVDDEGNLYAAPR